MLIGCSDTGYRYAGVDEHEQDRYICPAFEGMYTASLQVSADVS